jgi:RecA-family ATPase
MRNRLERALPKPLTALESFVPQPANWIIPGLLKRRNSLFIIGEPKRAAKSWLLFNLGWDLASGQNVWKVTHSKHGEVFKPSRPMRVVYFSQEDTEEDLHQRFMLMYAAGRIPTDNFWYEPKNLNFAFDRGNGETLIKRAIQEVSPVDLVMLDPMRRVHYYDENDSRAMASFWHSLDELENEFNCSFCFAHHNVKPRPDGVSNISPHSARGSGDIFGGADAFINVVTRNKRGNPTRSHSKNLTLHFETKRSLPIEPIDLSVNLDTGLVEFEGYSTRGLPIEER